MAESTKKVPMSDEEREKLAAKLDKDLDDFINGLEKRSYTEGWPEDRWREEMEKHPFFMTKPPEPGQPLSPLLEGIQQLKYSSTDNTPEELAATYKEEGNFSFKCKKYRVAIISFTEGIRQKCSDNSLNAQLFNNRAAANFFLQNYRSSLADCQLALKLQPGYEKSLVRAAQCCYHLSRFKQCMCFCDEILAENPDNSVIVKLRTDAMAKEKIVERNKRKEAILEKKALQDEEKLLKALQERNVRVVGSSGTISSLEKVEPTFPETVLQKVHFVDNRLVWPVLFLYPEYQTSDFVQEFHEDSNISSQLQEVFAEPPDWDIERKYTLDNIRVYFEDSDGHAHIVNQNQTLGQVISSDRYRVDGGTPAFIIVAKNTKAEERIINQ